jgi:uncharacterized protein with PQ loop repeat
MPHQIRLSFGGALNKAIDSTQHFNHQKIMEIFAAFAGLLCTVSFIPQILSVLRGNFHISWAFLWIYACGVLNWAIFSLTDTVTNWPLFAISALQLFFVSFIITIKKKSA